MSVSISPIKNKEGRIIGASTIARDITTEVASRKQAEDKLAAASQYARSLIESSLDPLVTISAAGKITDVNEATIKVTGISREELIGTDFFGYFTEPQKARKGYQQVFARGFVTDYPLTIRHKDGCLTDVLYNAGVHKDTRGNILGVFAAARDITARKRAEEEVLRLNADLEAKVEKRTAQLKETNKVLKDEIAERERVEEALRESEERLQLTLQASEVGTFEVDLTTGMGRWNAIEYELLGLKPEDAPGGPETFFRYVHPQDVAELRARWEEATRTGRLDAEFRVIRADGQERWLAGKGQFLFAETADAGSAGGKRSPLQFLGLNFDITERKRAEEERKRFQDAIQEERDRLSALVNSITDEIWFADTRKKFTLANPSALREFGLDTTGNGIEVEKLARNLETFRPDGSLRPMEETPPLRSLQGEVIRNEEEIIRTPASGELRYRQISSTPVRNAAGTILGSVSVVRDITELKQLDQELRKSRDELELRVQERTEELAKSQIRLQSLSSQLLLAQEKERKRVAIELHDGLLSELAGVKYLLEARAMLWEQGKIPDLTSLKRISDILAATIREARAIMNNLHPPVLDELGLIAALNWLSEEYLKSYPHIKVQKKIEVMEQDIERSLRVVIYRILQEALNNFAKHGKGDLVDLSLTKSDTDLALVIRDNGQGFDVENVQKGLGLESMKERIELSGGEFQIESIISQGTTIRAIWSI